MDSKTTTVSIAPELYQELRTYCDMCGRRFTEFVEEVLEYAIYGRELESILNNEAELKRRMAVVRASALMDGFTKGVLASSLLMLGRIRPADTMVPDEIRKTPMFEPVKGEQRKLFD